MTNRTQKRRLYRAVGSARKYDQVIRAASPLAAARVAFEHAEEIGAVADTVTVWPLVEPEDRRPGLCYEANRPCTYARDGGRIFRRDATPPATAGAKSRSAESTEPSLERRRSS